MFGSLLAGMASPFLSNLFSGGAEGGFGDYKGDIMSAIRAMQQNTGQANQALQPFADMARNEMPNYMRNYNAMLNPNQFMRGLMGDYQESPWAKHNMNKGMSAGLNAASASGMLGSGNLLKQMGEYGQEVSNADQQRYFDNLMNIHGRGMAGQQSMLGMTLPFASQMSNNYMNQGKGMAGLYKSLGEGSLGQSVAKGRGTSNAFSALMGKEGMGNLMNRGLSGMLDNVQWPRSLGGFGGV